MRQQTYATARQQQTSTIERVARGGFATWLVAAGLALLAAGQAQATITCTRTLTADVVAFDQPIMYNRLGASNINGMMFALKRDVVDAGGRPLSMGGYATPGRVSLRPDKRPRPLVLRVAAGDCLTVILTNLLTPNPNPFETAQNTTCKPNDEGGVTCTQNVGPRDGRVIPPNAGDPPIIVTANDQFHTFIDEQVKSRFASFHVNGMQLVDSIASDGSYVGRNASSLRAANGGTATYRLYAEKEGVFLAHSYGATIGADANQGNSGNGLFGQVIVEPKGARIYRSLLLEEEMRLVAGSVRTATGHPIINYEATYPTTGSVPTNCGPTAVLTVAQTLDCEGKGGLPILNMIKDGKIVHSELEAMIVGPNADGSFPASTYPLESKGYRNPTIPNRLEPFRDLAQVWHDEPSAAQAFPGFYNDPVFRYVLAGVKDGFMINYGSGGIGSEIIANRLGVGPMHDCLSCAYEEFFLTSYTVGDPALLVDIPANVGLEACTPSAAAAGQCTAVGPKANYALYPNDPINVHHAYIGDFVKFRNTHVGKEQHVFHLHNHQWLYNPNDDNSNYLDAQSVGPGVGYTYEINFGGSGNRNKSAGDAIFHCHFYPHFAQGMWYHLRNHDVLEEGTKLLVSQTPTGFHNTPWALQNGTPASGSRALPDGEIIAGVPLVAVLPLPGRPMAPIAGKVDVVPSATRTATGRPVGSVARVDRSAANREGGVPNGNLINPGYPFWIAGIEDIVGQRPPTPPLDMVTPAQVDALKVAYNTLFATLDPAQADGWDGGLPRHALKGMAAGGRVKVAVATPRDFTKILAAAEPVYYPEGGTDVERAAMRFHWKGAHPTSVANINGTAQTGATFRTNGVGPVIGAPYHEPCRDDNGVQLKTGVTGNFFSGGAGTSSFSVGASANPAGKETTGRSTFSADNPRRYKGVNIQFDAILNKVGYHYPQQRIITLWEDAVPVITKQQPPEPLVIRLNTFDCALYSHSNLVPEYMEMDDYQVRTPTDIIGQHIHLPKWDLTTSDGAANGWNYEDGTLSPGAVRERIHAINERNLERVCNNVAAVIPPATAASGTTNRAHTCPRGTTFAGQTKSVPELTAASHPYFGQFKRADWMGARTTMQRWFVDPVVNTDGVDRGLGIIFTHDHYGPSTHQQIGLYATVLIEPAGSRWVHNETGVQLGAGPDGTGGRMDGGPTSWQAAILSPAAAPSGVSVQPQTVGAFREFYLEFSDFQHAYEAGVYVGADAQGVPIAVGAPFPDAGIGEDGPNPRINRVIGTDLANAFRYAINPPARFQINPVYPDLVVEAVNCVTAANGAPLLTRPCPQAIDVQDPGMFVVNYRNEPIALRVFDPAKLGPDLKPGMQADGIAGDLAFALSSQLTDKAGIITPITRKIDQLNKTEAQLGFWTKTLNAPTATQGGDPFTPMMRTYAGDTVRVKIQAGGHEEEHNATVVGLKWLQAGSGHGKAPNSGWRNSQAAGISEQFTLMMPMHPGTQTVKGPRDYAYNIDSSMDGWWSGTWGLMRSYDTLRADLVTLPNNTNVRPDRVLNRHDFAGVCPKAAPVNAVDVIAILANHLLPNPGAGVTLVPAGSASQHVGGALNANGGSLVYNPRKAVIPVFRFDEGGEVVTVGGHAGPLHDPTAMLYVDARDVEPVSLGAAACTNSTDGIGVGNANCQIRLKAGRKVEPLVLRARANDCVKVTLYNRLPALAPDLPTLGTLIGAVKRDRMGQQGSVPFDNNLIRPSSHVGLVPQLAAVDVEQSLGMNVGTNVTQTVRPVDAAGMRGKEIFTWYMGDLAFVPASAGSVTSVATPVEFGGVGLSPADKVKQGQKSLVGGMVVSPQGATVTVDAKTRAQATVTAGGKTYRDFMLVMTKDQNHRYADGAAVEHMNGEGAGIPEDSQENSNMAMNYGIEPLWFRLGIAPNAPFGGAGCGPGCYGGVANAEKAYSNNLTVPGVGGTTGDPVTPIFLATRGMEVRLHTAVPHSTSRGTTMTVHGHVWQRDPYVCPGELRNGMTGACNMTGTGSKAIGDNPIGFAQGAQDSFTPLSHWTFRLPSAGGRNGVAGDYLFRDLGSFGNASGLWGLLRVAP
jgi:hypothetical protein